ncbi:ion transporter [Bacillus sp. AGMB 02131]|uniref:Ion transporter n=1 Tax=Peribacillus faecalis TaxID=2772559 RepID=A0A927HE32_9BACI|nr:potassium channel family protein [Peribacillus faecalis]MBD3110093.1 ion transporter [Peribacillus faecalis]
MDVVITILTVVSLIVFFINRQESMWINKVILVIFFCFILYKFIKSDNKWEFIKTHPLELIALIPIDDIFRGAMIIRFFRLIVVSKTLRRAFPRLAKILQTNDLYKVIVFTFIIIILAAIPMYYFETDVTSFAEGIWWGIVTTTTVGYGDIIPVTVIGRITAVLLMLIGIGCIGMITGSVATFFSHNSNKDDDKEYIKKKIDQLEKLSEQEYKVLLQLIENKRK